MEPENIRLIALFTIHTVGLSIATISVYRLRPLVDTTPNVLKLMSRIVIGVLVLTGILAILTPQVWSSVFKIGGMPVPLHSWLVTWVTFQRTVFICALIDLIGVAILIYLTGGSCRSIYTPYLLVIVPLMITIEAVPADAWMCYGLSIIIFIGCSFFYNKTFDVIPDKRRGYYFLYALVIGFCVFVPTGFRLLK